MMQHPEGASNGFAAAAADPDSDAEDDPGQLLNLWLGELNTLKKVSDDFGNGGFLGVILRSGGKF